VKGYVARRRKSKWRVPGHLSREKRRRRGAFDNPLGGMEFGLMLFTSLIGYGAASFGDRYLSTKNASGSLQVLMGEEMGMMDLKRLALGLGVPIASLVGAHYISKPALRSVVQGFGFGFGLRTLGHLLDNGIAKIGEKSDFVRSLYAPEVAGQASQAQIAALTTNQQTGTGALPECATCGRADGLGKCCRPSRMEPVHRPQAGPPPFTPTAPQERPISDGSTTGPVPPAPPRISMTPPAARPLPPPPSETPQMPAPRTPATPATPIMTPATPATPVFAAQPAISAVPAVGVNGAPRRIHIPNYNWGAKEDQQ
jgi:hypothetical protein